MNKIISLLKRKLINFLRIFNIEISIKKNLVKYNSYDAIHAFIAENYIKKDFFIIFDVGTNRGRSIDRFKRIVKNPIIHSFEPTPHLFEELKKNYVGKNIFINQLAVSEKNETKMLYSYKHDLMNSLFPVKSNSKFEKSRILASNSTKDKFVEKLDVKSITVDEYCKNNHIKEIDILRIDTQGYEDKVLQGAKEMLRNKKINVIELELIIGIAFEKTLSFYDIEVILKDFGYKLISIQNAHNVIAYSNYQTNLIYVKENIYKNIEEMHLKNIDIPGVTRGVSKNHPYSY